MTLYDTLLGDFAGSFILLGLIAVVVLIMLLLILRVAPIIFISILIVALYGLAEAGLVPMWVFGISLIPAGVFIGKMILNMFFSSR